MCDFSLGTTLSGWRDVKIQELTDDLAELRSCVNKEVGPGPHSLSRSSPVPNKPYGFCGRKAPRKKKKEADPPTQPSFCEALYPIVYQRIHRTSDSSTLTQWFLLTTLSRMEFF